MTYETKDSGQRETFESGMVRDTREGKGRYDLIPGSPLRRLAGVYERGARKYDDHNWRKGAPFSRFLDSALRHLNTWKENEWEGRAQDEDHLGQALWNIISIMYFEDTQPELNDVRKK